MARCVFTIQCTLYSPDINTPSGREFPAPGRSSRCHGRTLVARRRCDVAHHRLHRSRFVILRLPTCRPAHLPADKQLQTISREAIRAQLAEVGFSDELQAQSVGSLSGGWKMKLELARAMLYKADLLLLGEHIVSRLRYC